MNKSELAAQMVEGLSITKNDALNVIDAMVDVVTDELKNENGKFDLSISLDRILNPERIFLEFPARSHDRRSTA